MEAVSGEDFLRWAAGMGVGFHPLYPGHLTFLPPADHARFYNTGESKRRREPTPSGAAGTDRDHSPAAATR